MSDPTIPPVPSLVDDNGKAVLELPACESTIFGISLRGIITIIVILTICIMAAMGKTIEEPLYSLGAIVVSFYFGHQIGSSKKS